MVSWHMLVTTRDLDKSRRLTSWDMARLMWWRAPAGRVPQSNEKSSGFVADRGLVQKCRGEDAIVVGKPWSGRNSSPSTEERPADGEYEEKVSNDNVIVKVERLQALFVNLSAIQTKTLSRCYVFKQDDQCLWTVTIIGG